MSKLQKFYIAGQWVDPVQPRHREVINPATECSFATISLGSAADIDAAVMAAKEAFSEFSMTSATYRIDLTRILNAYNARDKDLVRAVSKEMGAPMALARDAQAWIGQAHLEATIKALKNFSFHEDRGATRIQRELIGVCALITPWNWPLNQIVCKVAPAIAVGCTVVLKPSQIAPTSGIILAEIMDAAWVPAGVFNLLSGTGPDVGVAMSSDADVDMVSFLGSTCAGISVAEMVAPTVKRVSQALGGKSANILLPEADFAKAVSSGVAGCFGNTGQSCDAPSRMQVPMARMHDVARLAAEAAAGYDTGDPHADGTDLGPVISQHQFDKIQSMIQSGIDVGATLVAGGAGRPEGLDVGYFVKPTIFANVSPNMTISREEIFGPVLSIIGYEDEADAIRIANDTVHGLAGYIRSADMDAARRVTARLRVGTIMINAPDFDAHSVFGGHKQFGNGREYADFGLAEFLETKSIVGFQT
ncbi:aldehyde dehydrogenase family protein [Thioclava kandeliae]|uniref:Aldehyde dehydrogenase family protein n=1 Tax=Thioclava kandeliae TaxID=3070818 RepID=A0ABV1SLM3_9RHOB